MIVNPPQLVPTKVSRLRAVDLAVGSLRDTLRNARRYENFSVEFLGEIAGALQMFENELQQLKTVAHHQSVRRSVPAIETKKEGI